MSSGGLKWVSTAVLVALAGGTASAGTISITPNEPYIQGKAVIAPDPNAVAPNGVNSYPNVAETIAGATSATRHFEFDDPNGGFVSATASSRADVDVHTGAVTSIFGVMESFAESVVHPGTSSTLASASQALSQLDFAFSIDSPFHFRQNLSGAIGDAGALLSLDGGGFIEEVAGVLPAGSYHYYVGAIAQSSAASTGGFESNRSRVNYSLQLSEGEIALVPAPASAVGGGALIALLAGTRLFPKRKPMLH